MSKAYQITTWQGAKITVFGPTFRDAVLGTTIGIDEIKEVKEVDAKKVRTK